MDSENDRREFLKTLTVGGAAVAAGTLAGSTPLEAAVTPRDKALALCIIESWKDPSFKKRFVENPSAALAEKGWTPPKDIQFKVVESTSSVNYIILPPMPKGDLNKINP